MKQTSVTSALLSQYVQGPAKLSMDPDSCDMEYGWDIGGRAAFSIRVGLVSTRREESEGAGFVLDCELVMLFLAFPLAYGSQRRRARDRCVRDARNPQHEEPRGQLPARRSLIVYPQTFWPPSRRRYHRQHQH
jgi:hypothetical protein